MKKSIWTLIILGLILVLAACGGNNEGNNTEGDGDNAAEETENADSSEDTAANNDVEITATNWSFDQDEYVVNAGKEATITLTNEEGMHGITIDELDVAIDGEGDAAFTPEEPGEYTIYCSIPCGEGHDEMTSTLVVQ